MAFYDLALRVTQHYFYNLTQIQGERTWTPPIDGRNAKQAKGHILATTDYFQPTKMLNQNNW